MTVSFWWTPKSTLFPFSPSLAFTLLVFQDLLLPTVSWETLDAIYIVYHYTLVDISWCHGKAKLLYVTISSWLGLLPSEILLYDFLQNEHYFTLPITVLIAFSDHYSSFFYTSHQAFLYLQHNLRLLPVLQINGAPPTFSYFLTLSGLKIAHHFNYTLETSLIPPILIFGPILSELSHSFILPILSSSSQ